MKQQGIFLAGQFVQTQTSLEVLNPFDLSLISTISLAESEHINLAIKVADKCKKEYQATPLWKISEALKHISHQLEEKQQELAELLCKESGKPMIYSLGEVNRAIQTFLIASEECKRPPSEIISLDWSSPGENKNGYVHYFSKGIVAGIAPFNFPINLVAHKIAPAIATRSPIILKPSSTTPLSALFLAEIISSTDLPKGSVSILPCSREVGQQLVEDDRINVLSFTGSPIVGWKMKAVADKKKVILELGGNAAAIVHSDADLDKAISKLLVGGFAYSGQVCIHTQRIFIHSSLFDAFVQKYKVGVEQLKIGDPMDTQTNFGVMIDRKNANRVMGWITEAISQGASPITGNKQADMLVYPTILLHAIKGMKVWDEEVFGPVVCLTPYDKIEKAIDAINDCKFGLQAAIFSDSQSIIHQCFNEIEVGGLIVNESTTFRVDQMPYGGVKDSGFGREGVKYAMLDYLEPKILVN